MQLALDKKVSRVLIATDKTQIIQEARIGLDEICQIETVQNGKDCQLKLTKSNFDIIILDLALTNYSALEVIKFIKLKSHGSAIYLFTSHMDDIKDYGLDSQKLKKIGITQVVTDPSAKKFKNILEGAHQFQSWKNVQASESSGPEEMAVIGDDKFTRIKISEFYSGSCAIFNIFIRLSKNKYKKIFHKSDQIDVGRINNYEKQGVEYLYFLTSERGTYINFMNELVANSINRVTNQSKLLTQVRTVTDFYLEEIYTKGIKPEMVEEGKKICQNIYKILLQKDSTRDFINNIHESSESAHQHSFLVSFFSVLICRNLEWAGTRTIETLATGSLLHDLGTLKLPPAIRNTPWEKLSESDKRIYKEHTRMGAAMLKECNFQNKAVWDIIEQHHERSDGSGYPLGLSGSKIYPLAKIVGLADEFSHQIVELGESPKTVLKEFCEDRNNVTKYDATLLKALITGFIDEK